MQSMLRTYLDASLGARLITLVFISELYEKCVLELFFREFYFDTIQNRILFSYIAIILDVVIIEFTRLRLRPSRSMVYLPLALIVVMTIHGVVCGIIWGNSILNVINDLFPAGFLGGVLLLFSLDCKTRWNISGRCLDLQSILVLSITAVSYLSNMLYQNTPVGLGGAALSIYMSVYFSAVFARVNISILSRAIFVVYLFVSFSDFNRSTILFLVIVLPATVIFLFRRSLIKMICSVAFIGVFGVSMIYGLSSDSPLYERLFGDADNIQAGTGSVGERYAEADAINRKLDGMGWEGLVVGAGYGARYEVARSWDYIENYGHAHFGSALFNLRFGMIGLVYLCIWVAATILSGIVAIRSPDQETLLGLFVALFALIYAQTWFVFNFYSLAFQFINLRRIHVR